jgi:putative FmdB family regulatory protein
MPNYDFECKQCSRVYDCIAAYDETGKYPSVKCPECNSKKKTKLMSSCNYAFSNPVGTDRWNSESSGHDYRFHHNLPKVIEERRRAEEKSLMGSNPYNEINDLNKDSSWGEVK